MSFWGIVAAAGEGRRYGGTKHDALLGGKPLWEWSRDALLEGGADGVIVVGPVAGAVAGGKRRRDSVSAGLTHVPEEVEFVLVHDAVRPLATPALVRAIVDRLLQGDAAAVVPVVPLRDAVKRIDGEWVAATLDRSSLVSVQTPQGFVAAALRDAHATEAGDVPDDAALIELAGGRVATVPGEVRNVKVTYREDLEMATAML